MTYLLGNAAADRALGLQLSVIMFAALGVFYLGGLAWEAWKRK